MAPGGRVFKQTTVTGETIQDTQSLNESNNHTPAVNTDDSTRIRNGRGNTRGKGLEKMKKAQGRKMKIEIPVGKARPTKLDQSAKLSNELGIIPRNFLFLPNKWKELTREDKDAALIRCHFEGKHGHYVAKRNEKGRKEWRNEGLRITESTWRVTEEFYFTFYSSVLSPEGKDQVGGKRKQSAHHRTVPRSSIMSPNEPEHDDVEGWCKTATNYTKGRITELIGDFD